MKIARVEPFHVEWGAGRNRSAWVRIWSDSGAFGLGEASPMVHGNASLEIIASAFKPMLLGADPLEPRVIQDRLFHEHIKLGPEGAYTGALAAVDIALWDLRGKVLGQPVCKLLGGAWRRELPFYASIGGNGQRSVDEVCRVVEKWLELGPAQVKIRFDADKTARDVDLAGDIAKARAVRALVGDGFPLAFDSNNGYSVQGAIRVGRALEELGYVWFEEPVQHYHVESFAKVAAALDIAVSAGEQEYTLQGIKRLIEAGVDIVQPDIVKTGGFTGLADMAALARAYGVDFVPHQTQPSIGHTANLHFVASLTHSHHPAEYNGPYQVQDVVFRTPVRPVKGKFVLGDSPGLGLELDEAELAKRAIHWTSSARGA
ncbi:MAG TPA: mandelate racemase/muconate lactonizing enzyme family protein [Methylomirabilota bacterium]|nr:mandelate racemase/muconate lactonizing enzyme family protein [Methylomirabilota bacterium]